MSTAFSKLFAPGLIGKLEIRNRIAMAPMGSALADQGGRVSRRQIDYYAERARGGTGLIIIEASSASNALVPFGSMPLLSVDSDALIPAMADLADAVHDCGAKICMQLTPGPGRQGDADPEHPPIAPSAVPAFGNPAVTCHALTVEEIRFLVEAYGSAAGRIAASGFDAMEIHAHTGYLIDQFMSSLWNQRTDEYGGDLDRRMRFPLDLVQSARKRVGPNFPIIFRMSMEHRIPGGRDLDESLEIAKRLEAAGVDALNVDAGCYDAMDLIFPPTYLGDAPFAELAAATKKLVSIPVMVAGNITPEAGEALLESGKADFVVSGRGLIADPEWPNKVRTGHRGDVRPCIRCNEGCIGRLFALRTVSCSVNVCAGMERYYELRKAEKTKDVLVIGGGPAGLEAARVAALRGHHVTLMEKEGSLGGMLTAAATPPFKKSLKELVQYWDTQLRKLKVDVRLNAEVTPAALAKAEADAVVVACGGLPLLPPIPGIDGENVVEVIDWHLGRKPLRGQKVVMAGGGLSGCDAALEMAMQGKSVTIVEMLDDVALDLNSVSRISLMKKLAEQGIRVLAKHQVKEFRPGGLVSQGPDGKDVFVEGDAVVVAFGLKADNAIVGAVKEKWDEVYVVGDCVKPAKVGEAVRAGFNAGRLL
jgi:2-enoate reductase